MSHRPLPILEIGLSLPYADHAEDRLLAIFDAAEDLSAGSPELAAAIVDWPTRYHLSPERSRLLAPLKLGPGQRILEVGAGTGALTRYLAETGAEVTAVEGSLARARALATRCAGCDNVRVVCGPLTEFRPPAGEPLFDLALLVGVLEYSGAAAGGGGGASALLEQVAALLAPSGVLVLAIENQLGLKYLLGAPEDHLGEPWVGIGDYPGSHGVRTWARRPLARLLAAAGFETQRWFFPFPDYKLPRTVLGEAAYDEPAELVDRWVRDPGGSPAVAAPRRSHRVFLEAGLGPEVAPSFLVVAARERAAIDPWLEPEVLVYDFEKTGRGAARANRLLRVGGELRVRSSATLEQPFLAGPTLESLLLEACHRHDFPGLAQLMRLFAEALSAQTLEAAVGESAGSPFAATAGARCLPAGFIGLDLARCIATLGGLRFLQADDAGVGPVDAELVALRALWIFARDLVLGRAAHPWPAATTVDGIAVELALLASLTLDPPRLIRLRNEERALTRWLGREAGEPSPEELGSLSAESGPLRSGISS